MPPKTRAAAHRSLVALDLLGPALFWALAADASAVWSFACNAPLQKRLHLTVLFVAHDLSVVKHISDRVAVMYVGQLVELAAAEAIFRQPRHPYTAALMRAVPVPDPHAPSGDVALAGAVANPANPPGGMLLSPALSVRRRPMPHRDAGAPKDRARARS